MSLGIDGSLGTTSLGLGDVAPRIDYGFTLFEFAPDWSNPITETLEWMTSVIEAHDGTEQASALRFRPRRMLSFDVMSKGLDAQKFDALVYGSNNVEFAVPLWFQESRLSEPTDGSPQVIFDVNGLGFGPGSSIVLWESPLKYEFSRIVTIDAGIITLAENTFYEWPAGSKVYPIGLGRLSIPQSIGYFTSRVSKSTVTFEMTPQNNTVLNLPSEDATELYQGLEVFDQANNWQNQVSVEVQNNYMPIDSGVGLFDRYYPNKHSRIVTPHRWWLKTRQKQSDFRAFLQRRKGQLTAFWYVRQMDDISLLESATSGDSQLIVAGTHHAFYGAMNRGRDNIAIKLSSGENLYLQLSAISVVSGNTVLELTAPLTQDIALNDVVKFSFMSKCKLAADRVTIPWITENFCNPETFFRQVI